MLRNVPRQDVILQYNMKYACSQLTPVEGLLPVVDEEAVVSLSLSVPQEVDVRCLVESLLHFELTLEGEAIAIVNPVALILAPNPLAGEGTNCTFRCGWG
jgi:hypothetical protein